MSQKSKLKQKKQTPIKMIQRKYSERYLYYEKKYGGKLAKLFADQDIKEFEKQFKK